MIDITVDKENNTVSIDMKQYPTRIPEDIVIIIREVLDATKYAGETISLWRAEGPIKFFVKEWH